MHKNKICNKCKKSKLYEEFHRHRIFKDGRTSVCKDCVRAKDKIVYLNNKEKKQKQVLDWKDKNSIRYKKITKKWRKNNPLNQRNRHLKYFYGITINQYSNLLNKQDCMCAICRKTQEQYKKTFCVDHSRACCASNKSCGSCIRGLLCNECNLALGLFKENIVFLQRAVNYIQGEVK